MESTSSPKSKRKLQNGDDREEVTQKLFTIQTSDKTGRFEQKSADSTGKDPNKSSKNSSETYPETTKNAQNDWFEAIDGLDTANISAVDYIQTDRKSTRLNSSHPSISYAVF